MNHEQDNAIAMLFMIFMFFVFAALLGEHNDTNNQNNVQSAQIKTYPVRQFTKIAQVVVKETLDKKQITQLDIKQKKIQIASILDEGDRLLQ